MKGKAAIAAAIALLLLGGLGGAWAGYKLSGLTGTFWGVLFLLVLTLAGVFFSGLQFLETAASIVVAGLIALAGTKLVGEKHSFWVLGFFGFIAGISWVMAVANAGELLLNKIRKRKN